MLPITKNFILQRGCIADRNFLFLLTYNYEAALQNVPNGQLFFLRNFIDWSFHDFAWSGVSLDTCLNPKLQCYVLGRDGEILVASDAGFNEERIEDQSLSPLNRGPLQKLRIIDNTVLAVGMGRQAYKRIDFNVWVRFENGLPEPPPNPTIVGFNSIDGNTSNNLYAVGWGGEIWHYNGHQWMSIESPTNVILHDVKVIGDDAIYICGNTGVILKGYLHNWEIIEYKGPISNWRTMAWFHGILFIADGHDLYSLNGNLMSPVKVSTKGFFPAICLHSTGQSLMAVAADSAYMTSDGENWVEIPC
jgi:hypothetical protein